jgi:hypothetical protein
VHRDLQTGGRRHEQAQANGAGEEHPPRRPGFTGAGVVAAGVALAFGRKVLAIKASEFVVNRIISQPVSEADRLNGISKRYLVSLTSEAHRKWDTKTNTWGAWRPNGSVTFPAALAFEWKDGAWFPRESTQLKSFTPGPGESVIQPQRPAKDTGLPPGMSREK